MGQGVLMVIQEFMSVRSTGAIQLAHTYRDTENILLTIANEQGDGARIRQLLRAPGYVPESLFYMFAGRPDRILLRPPVEIVGVRKVDQAA